MKKIKFRIEFYTETGTHTDTIVACSEMEAFQTTVTSSGYYTIKPNEVILIPADKVICIKIYEDLSV